MGKIFTLAILLTSLCLIGCAQQPQAAKKRPAPARNPQNDLVFSCIESATHRST